MIYENNADSPENDRPLALVLGVNGGVGGQVSRMLQQRGWRVRAMTRRKGASHITGDVEFVVGDAMSGQDVLKAAQGVRLIVHAVNPPGYRDWEKQVLPMLDNTIAAAESCGARIVFPGTIYNFGSDAFPLLSEESPQKPFIRKGALRVEMERRLKLASMRGVPVLGQMRETTGFRRCWCDPGGRFAACRTLPPAMQDTNGLICLTWRKPLADCSTVQTSFRPLPSITWKVSGISTGCN